jgi:hypothetical protein
MTTSPNIQFQLIYAQVGSALNTWSGVEDGICSVFMTALSARNSEAAQRAFFKIISFDAKLSVCDVAIRTVLENHPAQLEVWVDIEKTLTKKKKIRNKLAHFQVVFNQEKDESRLFPYLSITSKELPDWNGGWSLKDIKLIDSEFGAVGGRLGSFIKQLRTELEMWPTDFRPVK